MMKKEPLILIQIYTKKKGQNRNNILKSENKVKIKILSVK